MINNPILSRANRELRKEARKEGLKLYQADVKVHGWHEWNIADYRDLKDKHYLIVLECLTCGVILTHKHPKKEV